jgi:catechol 2,3-dioxygenase-like lactoylglutathione lyase family enzyme
MPLSDFTVRASIAVSDIRRAADFYEGRLGLSALQSAPSAKIADGSRVYGSGGGPALNVYQSATAGNSRATMATWYVDDIEQIVDELAAAGVEFVRYNEF